MTEMLLSRGIEVTFLVRESSWMEFAFPAEESSMINREIPCMVAQVTWARRSVSGPSGKRALAYHCRVRVTSYWKLG